MRPRRTSHMQALRQHDTASAWLRNEFTLYISEGEREKCKRKESFLILWLRHKARPFIHGLFAPTSPPHPAELLLSFTCSASCKHTVPEKNDLQYQNRTTANRQDHFDLPNHAFPLGHHKIQHKVFVLRTCARFLPHRSNSKKKLKRKKACAILLHAKIATPKPNSLKRCSCIFTALSHLSKRLSQILLN